MDCQLLNLEAGKLGRECGGRAMGVVGEGERRRTVCIDRVPTEGKRTLCKRAGRDSAMVKINERTKQERSNTVKQ